LLNQTVLGVNVLHGRKTDPGNVIYAAKRVIGLQYKEYKNSDGIKNKNLKQQEEQSDTGIITDITNVMSDLPFQFAPLTGKGPWTGNVGIRIEENNRIINPEHVGALILKKLKAASETSSYVDWFRQKMGFKFYTVTISIPVTFTSEQRRATIRAGKMAGFKQVRLLEEPVAAALAFGLSNKDTKLALVFDFGGGTLDVAILNFNAYTKTFFIEGTTGNSKLGGEDFDVILADLVLSKYAEKEKDEEKKISN
jgi:molecular chaperone DnaK (HSP70)